MCSLTVKCEFVHYYLGKKKEKKKCLLQNLIFVVIWVFHSDHITFIKDVAGTQPPQHLCFFLRMLKTKGGSFLFHVFFFFLVPRFFRTWYYRLLCCHLGFLMSLAMCVCLCAHMLISINCT